MGTENRKFPRRPIDLAAEIEMADGSVVRCDLLDLSQTGVRLKIDHPEHLPEQFTLKLSRSLKRWARIVWRTAEEVGVEFLSAPQASADGAERRAVCIRCPKTGRNVATGIQLTVADDLKKISNVRRFTQCPFCKVVHGWLPGDATLEPEARPQQASAEAAS